jgi:branched-subunit amino acid aminotransferase/4-amino-4-deoxychorismate lyase
VSAPRVWTLTDGVFHEGASVPLTDRGFRYGMSVFETLAVRDGRLLFAGEHCDRLMKAAEAAGFYVSDKVAGPLSGIAFSGDGMLRLYITAGDGRPVEVSDACRIYGLFEAAAFSTVEEIASGYRVGISRAPIGSVLGGWKTGNYWPQVSAYREAANQGLDETLVMNMQGELVSASMANLFLFLDGLWRTPVLASGARDGVVRDWVMKNRRVEESQLVPEDLERAQECFLTNSRIGVMPVAQIEGRNLPSRVMGNELAVLFREKIPAD